MNDRDQRRYDRDLRVQTFGKKNSADFAPTSKATALFGQLAGLILQVGAAKVGQDPNRTSKETLLAELSADFANISRTARAIAVSEPGFAGPFLAPDNPSEASRLTHGDSLLVLLEDRKNDTAEQKTAKAALRAKFVAYEMPEDFVQDLRNDLKAVRDANETNRGENQSGVENTALIGQLLGKSADIVQQLNAIMHNKYARQPEKLRQWQSASHTERAARKKADEPTAGGTP